MPRPPRTPHRQLAADLLAGCPEPSTGDPDSVRQQASAHALLAIAEELGAIREAIVDVSEALKGPSGDAGTSLFYISDWLKELVERRR